jgi:hypothetical protein
MRTKVWNVKGLIRQVLGCHFIIEVMNCNLVVIGICEGADLKRGSMRCGCEVPGITAY